MVPEGQTEASSSSSRVRNRLNMMVESKDEKIFGTRDIVTHTVTCFRCDTYTLIQQLFKKISYTMW